MSRTWMRRPRRSDAPHGRGRHRGFAWRACCHTVSQVPHATICRRDPAMCGVKAVFDFHREASAQADQLGLETGWLWRAYRCPWCELWHLTTQEE